MACICLKCKEIFNDLEAGLVNSYLDSAPCQNPRCQGTVILVDDVRLLERIIDGDFEESTDDYCWNIGILIRVYKSDTNSSDRNNSER